MANLEAYFDKHYPTGTEVVVIDADDRMVRGKVMSIKEDGMAIKCGRFRTRLISWSSIRFIADDGYPVREVGGPHKVQDAEGMKKLRCVIRVAEFAAFKRGQQGYTSPRPNRARFGDPFEVEYLVEAHNIGLAGPHLYESFDQECLIGVAPDGARAMLWDLDSVFEFGP